MTALLELLGRAWAAIVGVSAKKAAAELPAGEVLNRRLEDNVAKIERRLDGPVKP